MNLLFRYFLKTASGHAKRRERIYMNGFYLGVGIFSGILLNDVWRVFGLPGNNHPLAVPEGHPEGPKHKGLTGSTKDEFYQRLLATGIVGISIIMNYERGMPFGTGMLIGVDLANKSERGEYIGFI